MGVVLTEDIKLDWRLSGESKTVFIDRPEVAARAITTTIIICGNCAGDEQLPRRTLLSAEGKCSCCGGSSYVLASKFYRPLKGEIYERDKSHE